MCNVFGNMLILKFLDYAFDLADGIEYFMFKKHLFGG
jgi:hypothetical protein